MKHEHLTDHEFQLLQSLNNIRFDNDWIWHLKAGRNLSKSNFTAATREENKRHGVEKKVKGQEVEQVKIPCTQAVYWPIDGRIGQEVDKHRMGGGGVFISFS